MTRPIGSTRRFAGLMPLGAMAFAAVLECFPASVQAAPVADQVAPAKGIYYPVKDRPIGDVLKDIAARSGIAFRLATNLSQDKITETLRGQSWPEATAMLLEDYNYAVELGNGGVWEKVTIAGKNGDGKERKQPSQNEAFLHYVRGESQGLPARYRLFKRGSVFPVNLPLAALKAMKKGKTITLDLPPAGQYSLVHDNRFSHENGEITWVGYLENEGQAYRAMITMGKSGPMGHLITPDGTYQIETEDGQTYMVDVNASGLQPGSLQDDQFIADPSQDSAVLPGGVGTAGIAPVAVGAAASAAAGTAADKSALAGNAGAADNAAIATLDVLVLYGKNLDQADSRINYLTALTNQAYVDSKIKAKIRVVYRQPVDYTETNDNSRALSDLTFGIGAFQNVRDLRQKQGADLVTLIRPFHTQTQKNCGIAWVNGDGGSELIPAKAFSVVSDGNDRDGGAIYCGQQTLAHELGHNLGNVHDREFSNGPGAFAYSYGWGVDGSFGTIMSYYQPNLLLFANPALDKACRGQPCGYPEGDQNASDNARTINQTAPQVAGFLPSVVSDSGK